MNMIGYEYAHQKVKMIKGKASDYLCNHCGQSKGTKARDWAYNHKDNNEIYDPITLKLWSDNPDYYIPLCSKCHSRFDSQNRKYRNQRFAARYTRGREYRKT